MPFFIEILYLSVVEHKFYYLENELPYSMEKEYGNSFKSGQFTHVVIGMAPYGGIAVWIRGSQKSVLVSWMKGKEIDVDMAAFNPTNPEMSLKEYCDFYINNDDNSSFISFCTLEQFISFGRRYYNYFSYAYII